MKRKFEITVTFTADDEWGLPRDSEIQEAVEAVFFEAGGGGATFSDVNVESDDIDVE